VAANVVPNFKKLRQPFMSRSHLASVRQLPCCVCLTTENIQAHHLRVKDERGICQKATDRWAVPLCWEHHLGNEGTHKVGSREEARWFLDRGVDSWCLARELWAATGDESRMLTLVESHNFSRKAKAGREEPGI
jgi:hypothetical protein